MTQQYELRINGKTIPGKPFIGSINSNHAVFTKENTQNANHNKTNVQYEKMSTYQKQEANADFWNCIANIHWSSDNTDPVVSNIVLNKFRIRYFGMGDNRLHVLQYLTKMFMEKLRTVILSVDVFAELDFVNQNAILSHIVGSGEGTYNMFMKMPKMVQSIIAEGAFADFAKYIQLDMREKIIVDLDEILKEKVEAKKDVGEIDPGLEPPLQDDENDNVAQNEPYDDGYQEEYQEEEYIDERPHEEHEEEY